MCRPGNTIVSHFVVQRADLIVAIACVSCGLCRSHLRVQVRILGVLKIVCCCTINPDCRMPAVVCIFTESAACVLSFDHSTQYNKNFFFKEVKAAEMSTHFQTLDLK